VQPTRAITEDKPKTVRRAHDDAVAWVESRRDAAGTADVESDRPTDDDPSV